MFFLESAHAIIYSQSKRAYLGQVTSVLSDSQCLICGLEVIKTVSHIL
jgi:hypothetical protein